MEATNSLLIRPAERRDFAALATVERETFGRQGVEPYGEKYFETWLRTNNEGFLVAVTADKIGGYAYTQTVRFDPWNRPAAMTYDVFTDSGFTVRTHDPRGNSCQCISGAATAPGAGRLLLKESVQQHARRGIDYYFTFTRLAGFSTWLKVNDLLAGSPNAVLASEYELALWYARENGRITRGLIWPEVQAHSFPPLPKVKKLDSSLAPQLMVDGLGLLDVLPNCMTDPMSHDFAALLVKKLTP